MLSVEVKVLMGASIEEVAGAMISLAADLGTMVHADFNDVHICAVGSNTVEAVVGNYNVELHFRKTGKIAL